MKRKTNSRIVIGLSGVLALIAAVGTTSPVFASTLTPYQSGWIHGVSDAHGGHYYATPGKGPQYHTQAFRTGYIDGWCSVVGSGASSDADYATFDCPVYHSGIHQAIGLNSNVRVNGDNNRVVVNQQASTGGHSAYGYGYGHSSGINPRCAILCANIQVR